MSETGQPGAATPGEHGDGTGQHDDLASSGDGWAPPPANWSWDAAGAQGSGVTWPRPEPSAGWAAASSRHADLPAPAGDQLPPGQPPRINGNHLNGAHLTDDSSGGGYTPVSAPPGLRGPTQEPGGDRVVVPAPRPVPAAEQPDTPAPGLPTSGPPVMRVPPVGTTASGFEMPPGLHAPTAERAGQEPKAGGQPRGWDDGSGPEQPAGWSVGSGADRTAGWPAAERPPTEADRPSWAQPGPPNDWAPSWARDEGEARPARESSSQSWASEPSRPYEPVRVEPTRPYEAVRVDRPLPYEPSRSAPEPGAVPPPAEFDPADRPVWPTSVPLSAPPAGERPSWARPAGGPPPGERPTWVAPPVSAAPADEGLPWGIRSVGQPTHENLPWALRPVSAPPPVDDPPAGSPPAVSAPPRVSAPPVSAPPVSAPPVAERPDSDRLASPPAGSWSPRETPPESRLASPAPGAEPAPEVTGYRPFRLRPVLDEPAPGEPSPAPARPDPNSAPTSTEPLAGALPGNSERRERTPSAPAPTSAAPYAARRSAPDPVPPAEPTGGRSPDSTSAVLPQRVPAEPDVPVVPEPPAVEPPAETPELARIATHLRREDEPAPLRERPEGFDVNAILAAVREVDGVRDAALRRTPAGAHSLRLELSDGADPAEVSRQVARLLQDRMGLAAAPHGLPAAPARRRAAETRAAESGEGRPAAEARRPFARPAGARTESPPNRTEAAPEPSRRRRQTPAPHRGRAVVEETGAPGSPATLGSSYSGGQLTTTESAPSRPLDTGGVPGPRVVLDHVQVSTFGLDATVEVRLMTGEQSAAGFATGPAVDGYVLRLCGVAAAAAIDELLRAGGTTPDRGRCFVEHAAVVPFGNCEVATVVVLLVCEGWVEQLAGSALVAGDPRQAVVRATLAAVNRRLEALLA
ncbi:hypothetical protein ACFHWY_01630 [Micromonospora sp. LOL_024]